VALRRHRRWGRPGSPGMLQLNPSTVHRVLVRHGWPRWTGRPGGRYAAAPRLLLRDARPAAGGSSSPGW
jgi:hypothetical protein